MFLTNLDYTAHQRDIDMNILTDSNNVVKRNFAENAAIEQIKSYLRRRYDVDLIFIDILTWNGTSTYSVGDHVEHAGVIYNAILGNTNSSPTSNPNDWAVGDLRDPYLVMSVIDMAVYHLYAKIPNRKTPEDVNIRYGDALEWLKGVSTGEFIPGYPELADDDVTSTNKTKFGSSTKLNHRY